MRSKIRRYIFTYGKLMMFTLALVLIQNSYCLASEYEQIVLATGSPFELGLVQALAKPFEKETGYTVRVIKTPTEPGLELGKNGFCPYHHGACAGCNCPINSGRVCL